MTPPRPQPDRSLLAAKIFFGIVLVALSTLFWVGGREVFPPPGTDAAPHLIPIINYKAGHGFGGVIWELTRTYDPTGQHRFLQYPPLFHMMVAHLIRHATVESLYACLGWFAVSTLVLCAALMWQGEADILGGRRRPAWVFLASLGLCAVSTWLFQTAAAGRPESLTAPLIVLAVLVLMNVGPRWQSIVAGVFIGLVAAAQVVNGILLGLLYAVYASLPVGTERQPWGRWFWQAATAASLALLVFVGGLALGPHPVGETLRGIVAHARQLDPGHSAVVINYFSPSITGSFYGLFFLMCLAGLLVLKRASITALVTCNLGLLLIAVWYFAIRNSGLTYNVFAFVPMLAALAVRAFARPVRRRVTWAMAFAVAALMSVGLGRELSIFVFYERYGVSYADAKKRFAELIPPGDSIPVFTVYPLWPLATNYEHLYLYQPDKLSKPGFLPQKVKPMLILHQWYGHWITPPDMPGYQLVWDDFIRSPTPRLLGFQVSAVVPGYAFALYKPVNS